LLKVDLIEGNGLIVRFPARSWEIANRVAEALKETPPRGYRMVESTVKPRGMHKSGRRCNAKITFIYIDDRVPPLTTGGAKALLEPVLERAMGVEE